MCIAFIKPRNAAFLRCYYVISLIVVKKSLTRLSKIALKMLLLSYLCLIFANDWYAIWLITEQKAQFYSIYRKQTEVKHIIYPIKSITISN